MSAFKASQASSSSINLPSPDNLSKHDKQKQQMQS